MFVAQVTFGVPVESSQLTAAQRAAERAAEGQDWQLRHRSILDALSWHEREAWLAR